MYCGCAWLYDFGSVRYITEEGWGWEKEGEIREGKHHISTAWEGEVETYDTTPLILNHILKFMFLMNAKSMEA